MSNDARTTRTPSIVRLDAYLAITDQRQIIADLVTQRGTAEPGELGDIARRIAEAKDVLIAAVHTLAE